MSSTTYKKSVAFKTARDFLVRTGLEQANDILELKIHQPLVFLLPPQWREYKPTAREKYESAVAIIENPTKFAKRKSNISSLEGEMDMYGVIAYFALPIDRPTIPVLLGGEVKRATKGIITRFCYQGPKNVCYDLFPIDKIKRT